MKDGGVTYKDKNIFFNDADLKDILFAENFDLVVKWEDKTPKDSKMIFKNVTLFFKINSDKDNFKMADWTSLKTNFNVNTGPDFANDLKLDSNSNFKKDQIDLGVSENTNQAYWFNSEDVENANSIEWNLDPQDAKHILLPNLFTVGNEDKLTVEVDSSKKGYFDFSFDSSNIFASFEIDGKAKKKDGSDTKISAMFVGMFSKDNSTLKLANNFFVDIDFK
ncbi:hypothetical protein JTY60_01775 [symbiont of Argiope bruennichi]|uniref:hypothetical protein n=1 Tax=symbiont of Argiope bruennichi TaxID=2810479 RepID=UPI003DA39FF4